MPDLFVLLRPKGAGSWTVVDGPLELGAVAAAVAVALEQQPGALAAVARAIRTFRSTSTVAEDAVPSVDR